MPTLKMQRAVAKCLEREGAAFVAAFIDAPDVRRAAIVNRDAARCLQYPDIVRVLEPRVLAHAAQKAPFAAITYCPGALVDATLTRAARRAPDAAIRQHRVVFPRLSVEDVRFVCLAHPELALSCCEANMPPDVVADCRAANGEAKTVPDAPYSPIYQQRPRDIDAMQYGAALRAGDADTLNDFLSRYHAAQCCRVRMLKSFPFPLARRTLYDWLRLPALKLHVAAGATRAHAIAVAMRKGDLGPLRQAVAESDGRTSTIATIAGVRYGTAYRWLVMAGFIDPKQKRNRSAD